MKRRAPNEIEPSSFEQELQRIHQYHGLRKSKEAWARPELKPLNPRQDALIFQQVEIDHIQDRADPCVRFNAHGAPIPVFRLFGVTADQNSVTCHVHGFLPYFYVQCPNIVNESNLSELHDRLEKRMREIDASPFPLFRTEIVQKTNVYGFVPKTTKDRYIRITCTSPNSMNAAKRVVETGFSFLDCVDSIQFSTFESNIPFVMRFMVDTHMTGVNWIELPANKWTLRSRGDQISTSQIECDIYYEDLASHAPEGPWSHIAPLRILSFDIECAGRKGVFPEAQHDPVIQVAAVVTVQGESTPLIRTIFSLNSCAPIVGAEVLCFNDEVELLNSFGEFFGIVDPDVVIGYNIANFDFPYLLDRATAIRAQKFPFLGRIAASQTKAKDTTFSSKAYGTRESKTINLDGRIIFDILQVMQRDYKLRSYSLNSVSAHFLNEQKEDVPHGIITDLFKGNDETRRRLAVYCLKDAYLPQRLMDKLMCLVNYIEMARVTGIPFNFILARGQQVKVVSQLYRKAAEENYIIPALKTEATEEQYEGATVIEPTKGYYDIPIATLDFASLYPSIMMAHNLCYTTLLNPEKIEAAGLGPEDYIKTPTGDYFVKSHIRKGILPTILEDLISARKRAKKDLKNETDPFKKAVLDGRQLALKISANSVYGFTGATVGKLPCIQISASVTAFGRQMIDQTQQLVEAKFTKANGYENDAVVIYGDTDSVMVKFGSQDLAKVMEYGKEAAQYVTKHFINPISLEFEKCYFPYLLISKKRYAGLYWTNPDKYDKMDTKGIETVRRDNCRLVQTLIDTCLRKILIDRDVEGAKDYAKKTIADLLQNKIDLSQLVITKALSKSGEDYAGKQAHVELAERMKKRDAGSAPALGDRVAYVIIKSAKGAAAYEKSEDPLWVLENNLPIDTKYYLDNQLTNPLMRIFEPIVKNPDELFAGEHTRTVHVSAPTSLGALSKFAVKVESCAGCRARLAKDEVVVCQHCRPRLPELYMKQLESTNEMEAKYSKLWTQCQRCQGSLHQDVLCTSRDCPIFYMRKKAQKEITDAASALDKFSSFDCASAIEDGRNPFKEALISNLNSDSDIIRPFKDFIATESGSDVSNYFDLDVESCFDEFFLKASSQDIAVRIVNESIIPVNFVLLEHHKYRFRPSDFFKNDGTPLFDSVGQCLEYMTMSFLMLDLESGGDLLKSLNSAIGPNAPGYMKTLINFIHSNFPILDLVSMKCSFGSHETVQEFIFDVSRRLFSKLLDDPLFHKKQIENLLEKAIRFNYSQILIPFCTLLANHPNRLKSIAPTLLTVAAASKNLKAIKLFIEKLDIVDRDDIYLMIETANYDGDFELVRFLISLPNLYAYFRLPESINYAISIKDIQFLDDILAQSVISMFGFALVAAAKLNRPDILFYLLETHRSAINAKDIQEVFQIFVDTQNLESTEKLLDGLSFSEFIGLSMFTEKSEHFMLLLKGFVSRFYPSFIIILAAAILATIYN